MILLTNQAMSHTMRSLLILSNNIFALICKNSYCQLMEENVNQDIIEVGFMKILVWRPKGNNISITKSNYVKFQICRFLCLWWKNCTQLFWWELKCYWSDQTIKIWKLNTKFSDHFCVEYSTLFVASKQLSIIFNHKHKKLHIWNPT